MFGTERPVMSESAFFCFPSHGTAEQLKSDPSFCIAFSCTFWETEGLESPPGCFAWVSPEAYVRMLKNQNHIVTKSRLQWGNQAGVSANRRCAASLRGEVKTRCTEVWVNSIAADEMAPASIRALHTHELCVFFTQLLMSSSWNSSSQTSHRKTQRRPQKWVHHLHNTINHQSTVFFLYISFFKKGSVSLWQTRR